MRDKVLNGGIRWEAVNGGGYEGAEAFRRVLLELWGKESILRAGTVFFC
jgi:hypothetical protein